MSGDNRGFWASFVLVSLFPLAGVSAGPSVSVQAGAQVISVAPDADIVDDFDDGDATNYWNGAMGAMEEIEGTNSLTGSFVSTGALSGMSLSLAYDLTKASSWNGYFLNLNDAAGVTKDLSAYRQLSFWVRGAVGGVEHLKIGLENASAPATGRTRAALFVNDYLDGGITSGWQKVSIPLDAFANLDSKANAKTLTFVFERGYAQNSGFSTVGTVYIDDVRFSTVSLGVLRVDAFGDRWGANALGGNMGNFTTTDGATATSTMSLTTQESFPYSLRSSYAVNFRTPKQDWSGHFLVFGGKVDDGWTAEPVNLSGYQTLRLNIMAVAGGNPKKIKIELLSGTTNKAEYEVPTSGSLTTGWGTYSILLSAPSAGTLDQSTIKQMNIIYEKWRVDGAGGDTSGTVYYDKIEFVE